MNISFLFAWYDIWIGAYWDKKAHWLYILPIPMCGIILKFRPRGCRIKKQVTWSTAQKEPVLVIWRVNGRYDYATEHGSYVQAWKHKRTEPL